MWILLAKFLFVPIQKRKAGGTITTNCLYGACGSTLSIRWAVVSFILFPQHEGQNPRFLHESATGW